MKKLTKFILSALAAALVGTFSAGLVTGCAAFENARTEARPAVLFVLKEAYACGGAAAVSNRIEQLVVENAPENRASDLEGRSRSDGEAARKGPRKVTPEQAAQLHRLAQDVYDGVVDRMEARVIEDALAATNAPAATPAVQ